MFTTIITDCKGENEASRQITRFNALELGATSILGIGSDFSDDATIEGAANLIDVLDATEGKKGIIVVLNVAPRGNKKDGGNGTHFCYFYYKDTLVISTIKGYCLSFIPKFNISKSVKLIELSAVLDSVYKKNLISSELRDYIVKTQFRSFDFVPRLARWLTDKVEIPSTNLQLDASNLPPVGIWHIDAFGNCKLTLSNKDISFKTKNRIVNTNLGKFPFYERLKDVPLGGTAIYIGSSGIGDYRFLELATQGIPGSAAKKLKLKVGSKIVIL